MWRRRVAWGLGGLTSQLSGVPRLTRQNSSMKAWLAAFDAFEAMRPRTIVPAHGPVGDGSLIPILRTVMQGIQARVRELKAQGRPIDEVARTVQMEFTAMYPGFARANGAAGAARAAYEEAP